MTRLAPYATLGAMPDIGDLAEAAPAAGEYITTSAVAELFHVDRSAVRRWVQQGKITPAITTPGGHHRFRREDIDAMLSGEASA